MRTFTILSLAVVFLVGAFGTGAPAQSPTPTSLPATPSTAPHDMTEFRFPVAIATDASDEMKACAKRLARALGGNGVWEAPDGRNPVCCFWVEQTNWVPSPGRGGYVIIIQGGGAILYAASAADAERGVARIEAERQKRGDLYVLPIGLMTDYPMVSAREKATSDENGSRHETPRADD